jgi:transcriptional regulator with XRE-family HTH domain
VGAKPWVLCPWYRAMNVPSDDASRNFARRLAQMQQDRALSTSALAERAGIERADLDRILRGEGPIPLDAVLFLAGALGVEPGRLLEGIAWVPDGEGGGGYRAIDPGG